MSDIDPWRQYLRDKTQEIPPLTINGQIREEAAEICAIKASEIDDYVSVWALGTVSAAKLAIAASEVAFDCGVYGRKRWAEAECLLRTGWKP